VKPLVIVTAYNRPGATERCLRSLDETTDFGECTVAIVDDHSELDAWELVRGWAREHQREGVYAFRMSENGGTARALNYVIERLRRPGQAVVKIDNDFEMLTPNWNVAMADLAAALRGYEAVGTGAPLRLRRRHHGPQGADYGLAQTRVGGLEGARPGARHSSRR